MPLPPQLDTELLPITEVERQTGIRQATLRMWEKRYGFPQPLRDRYGDRVYPLSQVKRLQAVSRLIEQGQRPGKIFSGAALPDETTVALAATAAIPAHFQRIFSLLRGYRVAELHGHFQHLLLGMGLRRFIIDFLAPLTTEVGLAWSRGELPVRCEHVYAELAKSILHAKQAAARVAGEGRPTIVLATLTGETHALGIMMAEAVMASLGAECIQLGTETPPPEVAAAAAEAGADIVALSFSAYFPAKSMIRMVTGLRAVLPAPVELWAGGDGVPGRGPLGPGIRVCHSLDAIEPALLGWRAEAGEPPVRHLPGS